VHPTVPRFQSQLEEPAKLIRGNGLPVDISIDAMHNNKIKTWDYDDEMPTRTAGRKAAVWQVNVGNMIAIDSNPPQVTIPAVPYPASPSATE
jgi:hypothetical protein